MILLIHSFSSFYSILEHRASKKHVQRTLFPVRLLTSFQIFPAFRASSSTVLGLPLLHCPWGSVQSCLFVALWSLRRVCPIKFHFLLFIVVATASPFASFHRFSFVTTVGQKMWRIIFKHLVINTWRVFVIFFVIFHVSHPNSSTNFTFVENIFIFVFVSFFNFPLYLQSVQ
jgi:hypothetical protein